LTIVHINTSNNHTFFFQSLPNLLFPIPHTCPITAAAFATLSFTCSSCPPFLCNVYPKYLNLFTSSILFPLAVVNRDHPFPFHLQSILLLLPLPFLNLIILVFSLFNSKPFLSIYASNLSNILLMLLSSSASNTTSSAYSKLYIFLSPNFTPPI
ncbi:hypothetical protein ALC57_17415, partial [Trachymyrmex cornetzi]